MKINLDQLWHSGKEQDWEVAYRNYWSRVPPKRVAIVKEFDQFDVELVKSMSTEEFYRFLYDKYFVWKFETTVAPDGARALDDRRKDLEKYEVEGLVGLGKTHDKLFLFDQSDIRKGLVIAKEIHGLGIAGASGLLAVLFPKYFGTVDRFVVKSLLQVSDLPQHNELKSMNPSYLKLADGVILIQILRDKAAQLNQQFQSSSWTPQKIDLILWGIRN
ncbi:MAG: hypothetical protein FWE44_03315 [Defluviitaleaceae bacterium]|nr:hypothetical protein [Defluviitaleaceae bacterium]